jgi:hypothetical protein
VHKKQLDSMRVSSKPSPCPNIPSPRLHVEADEVVRQCVSLHQILGLIPSIVNQFDAAQTMAIKRSSRTLAGLTEHVGGEMSGQTANQSPCY